MISDIQLDCFLSLSQTLNFSETAKQLCLTQQAVSKNIARMENDLGIPMFERSSHGVSITVWGEQFLEINQTYLKQLSVLKEKYKAEQNIIRLSTLNQPDFTWLKDISAFPLPGSEQKAEFQITYTAPNALLAALNDKKADAIVTLRRFFPYDKGFQTLSLHKVSIALLMSPEYPGYTPESGFEKFASEPMIIGVNNANFFDTQHYINTDIANFNLHPRSVMILPTTDEAVHAAFCKKGFLLGTTLTARRCPDPIACIPIGQEDEIICAWNDSFSKSYMPAAANYLKEQFHRLFND